MVKVLQIAAIGLATTTLAVLAGCSQAPAPEAEAPADSQVANAPAADSETAPEEGKVAEGGAAEPDGTAEAKDVYRPVENVTFPAPGSDPLAMAFGLRQFTGETIGSEQMKLTYPAPDQAVVLTTVRGLPDDSVNAIRTRYEFKPVEGQAGQWQMVSVSEQNKCKAGRGSEDWTADLCQ